MTSIDSWTAPQGVAGHGATALSRFLRRAWAVAFLAPLAACGTKDVIGAGGGGTHVFTKNPCTPTATVVLAENQATRLDCSAGGTTITLAGAGASYLVVPQFATDQGSLTLVSYSLASGKVPGAAPPVNPSAPSALLVAGSGERARPNLRQMAADQWLRARGRRMAASGAFRFSAAQARAAAAAGPQPVPPLGSISSFKVLSNFTTGSFATVGAKLVYVGNNVLLYIDTLAPANGFTPSQLSTFGGRFDSTLFAIDTTIFGRTSDIDGNQRLIMLMSQVVNADTPTSTCQTQGFVAGFFNEEDFNTVAQDPNSNHGEIFFSIVPDTTGQFSCIHGPGEVGFSLQPTFLHELQHLINFSQHAIIRSVQPMDSWLDEGLSIIAEEQGSLFWEAQCPPPACRGNPAQLFPDSAQGFIQNFFFDSYQYAFVPDTSSLTKHDDSQGGFSWRGGAWLLSRWLGDHFGNAVYRTLEQGPPSATAAIAAAAGQSFPVVFANFGLALFTDSMTGLPRTTAPSVNRFTSRNMRQLWARLFATSGPSADVPSAMPIIPASVTGDTSAVVMQPGTMTFWRLDTPTTDSTVTIRFSTPAGTTFSSTLLAQVAVYRLPAGQ